MMTPVGAVSGAKWGHRINIFKEFPVIITR